MIDGLRRGIVDGFNNAVTAVKNGLNRVRNFFPFSPAKEGPFSGSGYTTSRAVRSCRTSRLAWLVAEADVVRQAEAITKAAAFDMPNVGAGWPVRSGVRGYWSGVWGDQQLHDREPGRGAHQ